MNKMTYVAALTKAIEVLTADAKLDADLTPVVDRLTELKAQTEKRNSAERKPTKNQIANASIADIIEEVLMNSPDPLTITEIMRSDDRLMGYSNQKVTAVVRGMGAKVTKVVDKRVTRFTLA